LRSGAGRMAFIRVPQGGASGQSPDWWVGVKPARHQAGGRAGRGIAREIAAPVPPQQLPGVSTVDWLAPSPHICTSWTPGATAGFATAGVYEPHLLPCEHGLEGLGRRWHYDRGIAGA
jgi:hypothetical protein